MTSQVTMLGLMATGSTSAALIILEKALRESLDEKRELEDGALTTVGIARGDGTALQYPEYFGVYKVAAGTVAIACAIASFMFEGSPFRGAYVLSSGSDGTRAWLVHEDFKNDALAAMLHVLMSFFLLRLVSPFGNHFRYEFQGEMTDRYQVTEIAALHTSIYFLYSMLVTNFSMHYTLGDIWLLGLFTLSVAALRISDGVTNPSQKPTTAAPTIGRLMGLLLPVLALGSLAFRTVPMMNIPSDFRLPRYGGLANATEFVPLKTFEPVQLPDRKSHPIEVLTGLAQANFNNTLQRQSSNLHEAVAEYRRRYGIPPPPNFDRWYEFAKSQGTTFIDEFDTIHDNFLPFWALNPSVIRARLTEALGYDENGLMNLFVRDGHVTMIEGGTEWIRKAIVGMVGSFVEHLPDMDIAFNIHDEPRVVVPHSELSQMVHIAKTERMPAANGHASPRNSFSSRPLDMNEGKAWQEFSTTRFNKFSHQATWSHSRLSCPPDSPARDFTEQSADNLTSYAMSDLGFIYNQTAFSDICNSPSLRESYGFFDRPNMFITTQDLIPVFSQSKLSSFQDILYPSPWYWAGKVQYKEKDDMSWEKKESRLYWRGSTTGGYSRSGGWRRHHRQRCVQKINAPNNAKIMANRGAEEGAADWRTEEVTRADFTQSIDVHFSSVGQCDAGDCHAQKEFFQVVKHAEQQNAWGFKYLLDMDGNAFSGRFYAFLKSHSLVYKMALFREWHADWLTPWLHYVPLSLRGDEWIESVRWFAGEQEGKEMGSKMAEEGRTWANKALRKEDMEVWFFRLLLE